MATTYSGLKTEILDWYERNDLASVVDTFIDLCEAEMQRELKLTEVEATAAVTVTDGSGTLPSDFVGLRSAKWDASPERPLTYVPPDQLTRVNASLPATVNFFTITSGMLKTDDDSTGTATITYLASFVPLSDSNTSNGILTTHPAAYLYGSLIHAAIYCKDFDGALAYRAVFENELKQIKKDNADKRYAGPMQVRPA